MPIEKFSGIFRLVEKTFQGSCLRLYFQQVDGRQEPFAVPVWWNEDYRPYRGAGPNFHKACECGELFNITVGESGNKKPVLIRAELYNDVSKSLHLITSELINPVAARQWRGPESEKNKARANSLIAPRNPIIHKKTIGLKAQRYSSEAERQAHFFLHREEPDKILTVLLNDQVLKSPPHEKVITFIEDLENNAKTVESKYSYFVVKAYAPVDTPLEKAERIFDMVFECFIQAYPLLEGAEYASIIRERNWDYQIQIVWPTTRHGKILKFKDLNYTIKKIIHDVTLRAT